MTWSLENSKNNEARKILWETIPYIRGRVLDVGCGPYKLLPHVIGIDSGHHWGHFDNVRADAEKLDLFTSQSCDAVFSSHLLEHFHYEKVPAILTEWMRVVKQGGHLLLYVPDAAQYPNVGHPHANVDHKFDPTYENIVAALEQIPCGWDLLDFQVRSETDEYSLWFVVRKEQGKQHKYSHKNPKTKTAAVLRFGAQGDNIQASSLLPWLKEQGYFVDFICQSGLGHEVIKHDPHIDRFVVCDKDMIPPQFLREFIEYCIKKYDKCINLSESVEVTLLAAPNRTAWYWPNEARAVHMNRNYLEWTHLIAGVPPPYKPAFYSTLEERAWARKQKDRMGRRVILWSLAGSSNHKVWPHLDEIVLRVMAAYPDVHVVLVGDETCKLLEQGFGKFDDEKNDLVETMSRVHLRSGKWSIRESMAFAEVADLIIGTETGLLNAAGSMEVPKVITLSHSSPEMLTKHWRNVINLQQPKGVGCPKSPCRQLHGGDNADPWMACMKHEETGTAVCQWEISPEMMWSAVEQVLGKPVVVPMRRAA